MHYVVCILLFPLMFIQARLVKKNTPKLPEAAGKRCGKLGQGPAVSLLVLGDSAAAGVGVDEQKQALSGTVSAGLAKYFSVSWQLLAKSGSNTQQTLQMLNKKHAQQPLHFDVVLVSLGVNDVLSPISAGQWVKQQRDLIAFLNTEVNCRQLILTPVPPMGQFPALPQPLRWVLGQRCNEFNRHLSQLVESQLCTLLEFDTNSMQAESIDLAAEPEAEVMAADGFHPGADTYKLWGLNVVETIIKHRAMA
ncbi:SGNH/GDSL hydrolase family protein [Shewanella youngdeokensis]|uniref:SGNH/GDSL hydrolase family protein n=1 Tax=Shewanella youngdeokensis TaxID=2999068 RepID=A0ABZ0JWT8_9GAMM|nr:SGNH/GDSL hydrolase family protein [Shewanella sp. DAU334]